MPVASDVRVGGDDKPTRFVSTSTQKIDIAAFTLADPYRVVIDLPQVTFKLPAKAGEQGRGLIKAFRYGLVMQGGSRIVIDIKGPVRVDKAFVLAAGRRPAGAAGARTRAPPTATASCAPSRLRTGRRAAAANQAGRSAAEPTAIRAR